MRQFYELILFSVSLCLCGSLSAGDWPQWRGANRDGKATGFNAPKTWPKELAKKWKATVGQADTTPALVVQPRAETGRLM